MRKLKLLSLFAAMLFATSMWATDPMGAIDGLQGKNGSFRVWGWAIDPDDGNYKVTIHVYVYTSSTATNAIKSYNAGAANISRPDLASLGYGTMHGYDFNLNISDLNPGTYYIRVFALNNVSSQNNPALAYSSDVYVKAVTVSASYTVSYDANGGTGAPTAQKKAQDVTLKLSSTKPTRTGYTFSKWNTVKGGTGTNYNAGANYTANASATLFAQWTANTYTVTFDKQNGTGGSNSVTATYASAMPSATMPTRTGYTFNGYFDAASGGTKYYNANGTSAKNWDKTANTTLYAQWTVNKYTVTFDKQNGTGGSNNVSATYNANMPSATMPTRTGYTFQGYYDATSGGTQYYKADGSSARTWDKAANTTLYARWNPITYTITYDYAKGEGNNPATYNPDMATFNLAAPTRLGYTFLGWTGSNGNVPQPIVQIATGSTGDKNYTAHWTLDPSTQVAYLDSLDNTVAQETAAFNRPEAPEVAGFTFVRWEVLEGPLSEGIKLQAVYAENKPSGAPKKQVGKFTLTRKEGAENEYILK